jgi:hypothetical protein
LAGKRGRGEIARDHLAKVNNWTTSKAEAFIEGSFLVWSERSEFEWTLDISWVEEHLA